MDRERAGLAGGYFWYFATLGVFVPYWPLYLQHRGLDAVEIGLAMGVFAAMRVVGPPAYAHWADASRRPLALLRAAAAAALACAVAFRWLEPTWALVLALALYSIAWNGLMSVYDAHVLLRLGPQAGRYGLLRLWGSVGFIVMAMAAGPGLEWAGTDSVPLFMAASIALTWLALAGLGRERSEPLARRPGPVGASLRDGRVLAFLAVSFLMLASHGAYYNFFSLYLERYGYDGAAIGAFWAWAVVAEIGVFLLAPRLLAGFGLRALTVAALGATTLRWVLLALWADRAWLVFAAQTLHLASFGLFHLCSVAIAQALFPRDAAARGQALHGSVGFGLGGMAGAVASGWLWREVSPEAAFLAGGAIAATAALLAAVGLRGLPRAPIA